jgi:hypothetical protein
MPIHRIYETVCCARWSVGIVRRPLRTDLKSAESGCIRCGTGSRRRDSVAVYQLGATGGHDWPGWSRHCGLG